jgi:hypothetical protein
MTMMINHHGGKCCGIKTISGLCYDPGYTMWAIESNDGKYLEQDACGVGVASNWNVYPYSRPKESAGERFDAYLDFLKIHRPCSLVEVTVVPYNWEAKAEAGLNYTTDEYQVKWVKFLEARDFKRVARFANCNSGNYVEVYHLVLRDEEHNWSYWESPVTEEFEESDEYMEDADEWDDDDE